MVRARVVFRESSNNCFTLRFGYRSDPWFRHDSDHRYPLFILYSRVHDPSGFEHFMSKDKLLNLTFTSPISKKMLVNTHFDFMGGNKKWLTITGVILLICIGSLVTRGLSQSIDFTGGRNFKVQFENAVEPEQVRELIASKFGDSNVSVIAIGTDSRKDSTDKCLVNFKRERHPTPAQ